MPSSKRQIIAKKFKGFFRTGEWQHTPQIDQSLPVAGAENQETVLSVLNSGVPLTYDIVSQDNNDRTADVTDTEDALGKTDTSATPLLRTPLSPISDLSADDSLSGDSERTQRRYQAAVLRLKEALDNRPPSWDSLNDVTENDDTSKLRNAIEKRLSAPVNSTSTIWSKGRKLFEQVFVLIFPLMKNILLVTKEGQSIPFLNPCGLICGGILLLITVASQELTRKEELEKTLDYISRELARVNFTTKITGQEIESIGLVHRAMDVRSAVINYIAVQICRETKRFGIIGNVATTLVNGDMDYEAARHDLQASVTEFNSALILLNTNIGVRAVRKLGHIGEEVKKINERVMELGVMTSSGITISNGKTLAGQIVDSIDEHFIIPYQKNEHFTGRRGLLAKLCEKLCVPLPKQYNHRVALHGLGGVGKTQLALEYVYTHKSLHDRIYWTSGVDQSSLLSGYQEIGRRTGCVDVWADVSPSDMAKSVISWLNKQENWLLVIDNIDDPQVVEDYLPERSPTKLTLLTTRNSNADELSAIGLEVDVLENDDAVELLSIRSGASAEDTQIKPEAEKIVLEVGCFPLAIEQAAAYIREVSKDIFKFLPSYRKNRKRHHNRVPRANWKYGESIASTWRMSFKQIEQNNKGASKLLKLLAFLNPDGIYTDFLESGQQGLDAELQEVVGDPDTFLEALSELERFSLIRRQATDGAQKIIVHRLVQWVIIDELHPWERRNMVEYVLRLGLSAFPDPALLGSNQSTLELSRRYRSQVMVCLRNREFDDQDCIYLWHRLSLRVAGYLYLDGYYDDCAKLASSTVCTGKISFGLEHPETLQSMHNLASTFRKLARADEALELFQETLNIRKRILGPDHIDTLQSMDGLGWSYADLARHNDAAKLHEESLNIKRAILGPQHPETLQSMHGLAWAYWRLGQYHQACALHQQTLDITKTILGVEHIDTLRSMDGLGWAQWRLGRYDEAAKLFQDSLDIRKRVQGENHPDTLFSLDGLAWAHWRLGRYQMATTLFQATLELNKVALGPEHPTTMMNQYGLAHGYLRLGKYTKAIGLFQHVIDVNGRILGPDHPRTLLNFDGLAWCHWMLGDYQKALSLHCETLEAYKRTLGPKHTDTIFSLYGMGWAQLSLGHYEEAACIFQERLEICNASLYPDHRDALMSKHGLASAYEKLGRYQEAIALFSETLNKRKEALAPEHPEIMDTMDGLASALRGAGRYDEARELFEETLEMRERVFGNAHPDTLHSLYGLAMTHYCVGLYRKAEELFHQILEAQKRSLGENHPDTLNSKYALAMCCQVGGRLQEAIGLYETVIAGRVSALGDDHPDTINAKNNLTTAEVCRSQVGHLINPMRYACSGFLSDN